MGMTVEKNNRRFMIIMGKTRKFLVSSNQKHFAVWLVYWCDSPRREWVVEMMLRDAESTVRCEYYIYWRVFLFFVDHKWKVLGDAFTKGFYSTRFVFCSDNLEVHWLLILGNIFINIINMIRPKRLLSNH